ncbi:CAP-Gly domain-containing linker protein 1 isoform X2 [Microcaecilia unicolor]|uniref:CAP-Gly domain-containing linker protein 1-like isoform X2 n=1 Tax=Microcaecilia unicolor TaxID=1415580 RepID=A0A6P7X4H2_9AMPH|nr:CAP-Gly domain-containing linker protein 1-like isoform X2 [Microcaecilia unicolor]
MSCSKLKPQSKLSDPLEPVKQSSSVSIMKIRRNNSETLPCVSGVSLGPHNFKPPSNLVANKMRAIHDKNEKTMIHKSIQNEEYTKAIETEKSNHELTKEQVKECQNIIEEKVQLLNDSTTYYETLMEDLQTQYQEAVDTVKKHSHLEIRQRDDKLVRLKQQIADMFKEKSWEHQQQLDELKNELTRMTEETEVLRTKLKTENLPKQQCPNCRHLTSKLEEKAISLKLKERTIEELQASCRRKIEMKEHQDPSDQKTVQF